MRSPASLFTGAALLACAGIIVACQGDPVGPSHPLRPSFAVGGGSSTAAHLCQDGGFQNVLQANGTGFANAGECVSYASHGGEFFQSITFSNISFTGCNNLTFGYILNGVSTDVYSFPGGCGSESFSDVTVLVPAGSTPEVFLRDNTCQSTFTQSSAHALVTGSNPTQIAITDAGGFCEATSPSTPRPPTNGGNLNVTETIP